MKHICMIVRHGDRSPTFNCYEPLAIESALEAAVWVFSLPTKQFSENLAKRFPIETGSKTTRDESLGRAFGSLTSLGVLQMRRLGEWTTNLGTGGYVMPKRVYSSNFRRTQFSAQCILAGLLKNDGKCPVKVTDTAQDYLNVWGTDPILQRLLKSNGALGIDITKTTKEEEDAKKIFMQAVPSFGFMIRPFSWVSALDHSMCREGKMGGGGPLRGRSAPLRAAELFREMDLENSGMLNEESLRKALDKVLQSPFSGNAAAKSDIEKLIQLIDKDGDGSISVQETKTFFENVRLPLPYGNVTTEEFNNASKVIEKAVCRRFDTILTQPSIRRISAGMVAKMALDGIDERLREVSKNPSTTTTIDLYSAHDVTLIPLLKHLKIWNGLKDPWPGVAAALAFEVTAKPNGQSPSIRALYWEGVRGELSGLEPRVLGLKPASLSYDSSSEKSDSSVDLEKFRYWAKSL